MSDPRNKKDKEMPNFDSPLGSKKFSGSSMKEFDIPDGEEDQSFNERQREMRRRMPIDPDALRDFQSKLQEKDTSEIEEEIRAAKLARKTGKERLNDGARRRIEMLVGMTRSTRDVDLEGNIFVLETIKSQDMREAIMAASNFDGTVESPFEIRRQLLARSLTQIAGVDVYQFVGSNTLAAKLELIDELGDAVLNRLFDEYSMLTEESKKKYAIRNNEDAKEVIEDLKK